MKTHTMPLEELFEKVVNYSNTTIELIKFNSIQLLFRLV